MTNIDRDAIAAILADHYEIRMQPRYVHSDVHKGAADRILAALSETPPKPAPGDVAGLIEEFCERLLTASGHLLTTSIRSPHHSDSMRDVARIMHDGLKREIIALKPLLLAALSPESAKSDALPLADKYGLPSSEGGDRAELTHLRARAQQDDHTLVRGRE